MDELRLNALVMDSLAFIRENAKVFRKYYFLPLIFSVIGLLASQLADFGLVVSTLMNSFAFALVGVSSTRFYILRDPDIVAEGANQPFARFFFLTFVMTSLGHAGQIFESLPQEWQSGIFTWMLLGAYVNIKICMAFPAISMDHPGSVWDNVVASFKWTTGHFWKIIVAFLICYCPVIFFTMMLMQVPALVPDEENFWSNLPQLFFSDALILFSMMWSSVVLAKMYQVIVLNNKKST